MNNINLIGKISSDPKVIELSDGKKIVQFSLATKESYLDEAGNVKNKKQWHRISAWGNWVRVMEELGQKGLNLAVEGRLKSRFYQTSSGERRQVTEVEVNDLIIL